MKFITLPEIKRMVLYQKFWERGVTLYRKGRVEHLHISDWLERHGAPDAGVLKITASVRGDTHTYHVRATYDAGSQQIGAVQCDCASFSSYPTICKHCVAVLLRLAATDVPDRADYNTNVLICAMERSIRADAPVPGGTPTHPLHADCKVTYDSFRGSFELTLRAGREKLYVVKDLEDFFGAMSSLEPVVVGNAQSFIPDPALFDDTSRALIEFVRGCYTDNRAYADKYYARLSKTRLELMGGQFDSFFTLAEASHIPVTGKVDGQELTGFAQADPPIRFWLKQGGGEVLFGCQGQLTGIRNADNYYIFHEGTLYHTTQTFGELFYQVYDVLSETRDGALRVSEEQAARFNALVVTPLSKQGMVSVSDSLAETFRSEPLEARVYLDVEDGAIVARTQYRYGDHTYSVSDSQNNPYRDVQQEYAIENLFAYGNFVMQRDRYVLPDEGDNVFDFVENVLPRLDSMAQVFLSEAFKKINIRYPHTISAGVRVSGELLELDFDFGDYQPEELLAMLGAYRLKKRYFKLRSGTLVKLEGGGLDAVSRLVDGLDISDAELLSGSVRLPKYRAMYLDRLSRESDAVRLERGSDFKRMIRDIREAGDTDFVVPAPLKKILRPYQKTGYRWMRTLAHYGMGGILADDMGLGKTLQVITLILSGEENDGQALIVVPTSLLYNWESEFKKFAPSLRVLVVAGSAAERAARMEDMAGFDVVVTSYELLKRDIDLYREHEFGLCIIDEAQNIKNYTTQNAKAVKLIRAAHHFALTGTPIENSLAELWSIFDFLMPGYLGSYPKFKARYEVPIVKNGDEDRSHELAWHISPFLLRRLKQEVARELPEKIETVVSGDMTQAQREIYMAYLAQARRDIAQEVKEKGLQRSGIRILSILTRLRQVCCHPSLFMEDYTGGSGKFDLAFELIGDCIQAGHRILLFSQFTHMLSLISQRLAEEGVSYFYLDGTTKAQDRMQLVERFNAGESDVFLISLKAGGNGLNLTGADVVIHYDPWWNPAVEDQATDRAYRIGQDKRVQVFKLIARDTIEEKIQALKQRKQGLINSVVQSGENFISHMSMEEIVSLFDSE